MNEGQVGEAVSTPLPRKRNRLKYGFKLTLFDTVSNYKESIGEDIRTRERHQDAGKTDWQMFILLWTCFLLICVPHKGWPNYSQLTPLFRRELSLDH